MANPNIELEVLGQENKKLADKLQLCEQENIRLKTENKALQLENLKLKDDAAYQKSLEENKKLLKEITKLVKGNHHDLKIKFDLEQQQMEAFM